MAKTKPAAAAPAASAVAKDYSEVMYKPLNRDDPHTIEWNGITFHAFVPQKISHKRTYQVLQRTEHTLADGSVVTKHVERPMSLVELARGNPSFVVDGVQAESKHGKQRTPESAPEYRSYCTAWMSAATDAVAMDARWDAEATLRERCSVDAADIAYLRPFFEARKDACIDAAKAVARKKDHVIA